MNVKVNSKQSKIFIDAMDALITAHADYGYGFADIKDMVEIGQWFQMLADKAIDESPEPNNADVEKSKRKPLGK